jgi:hypothetical protein
MKLNSQKCELCKPLLFKLICKIETTRPSNPSWASNAITFPTDMAEDKLPVLDVIGGLEPEFLNRLQTFTKVWFPVQKAVVPVLLKDTFLPPRDVVICSPTGIFINCKKVILLIILTNK